MAVLAETLHYAIVIANIIIYLKLEYNEILFL
jgi:hypothetical protein